MSSSPTSNPAGSPKVTQVTPALIRPGQQAKPEEFQRFEDLAGKLTQIPKSEVDEQRRKA